MKTKGKTNPEALIARATERFSAERERLLALPHPSPFMAKLGRTLADYVDGKLGPDSNLSLRAKLQVIYEVTRLLDGGTQGEVRELAREREARAALTVGLRVADRTRPGRTGAVTSLDEELVAVRWEDGAEEARTALSIAVVPG